MNNLISQSVQETALAEVPGTVPERKVSKIDSIDGLRAICALAVLLSHGFYLYSGQVSHTGFKLIDAFFNANGIPAVLIFFMISGLCIHLPIAAGKSLKLTAFFVRRSLRILPSLICVYCFISFLKFFIKSVDFDAPTWSLWVELFYYFIYPVLYVISNRIGTKNLLLISIAISVSATCLLQFPATFHDGNSIFNNAMLGLAYWVAGMFLAESIVKGEALEHPKFLLKIDLWLVRSLVILLNTGAYILFQLCEFPYTVSCALISPILFLYAYREIKESSFNSLLINIGIYSYSLYLFHQPIMQLINFLDSGFSMRISAFVLVMLACYLPYFLVERPSIQLIQRLKTKSIL